MAARVKRNLDLSEDPSTIQGQVSAEPVDFSNIVAITGEAGTAKEAADLANGFAEAAVEQRDADLRRELDERIRACSSASTRRPAARPRSPRSRTSLAQLENLRAGGDPTMRVQTLAEQPDSPASPKPKLTIAAGIFAGLLLGMGGAFAMHAIDPRLRREEQLRERFSLPILGRIPRERKAATETTVGERFGSASTEKRRHARCRPGTSHR